MIGWVRRMFRRAEPEVDALLLAEKVRSDAVLDKSRRVLTSEDRLALLRDSANRANRRLGHGHR